MLFFGFGCNVGPPYHRPAALPAERVPGSFSGEAGTNAAEWKVGEPAAARPRGAWWSFFGNPELDRLECLANANNQDLAAALARLDEARASVTVARSSFFPQLDLAPTYARQRTSKNQPENGHAADASHTYGTSELLLDASWEADLFGRVRNQVRAARARLSASDDDAAAVRLMIQGEVAADFYELCALDAESDLLRQAVEAYTRSKSLVLNRRRGGIGTDLDVAQAETQLRSAEAALPALQLQRSVLAHAIAVLCGMTATGFLVPHERLGEPPSPMIPVALPSELLERRPDISAAERRMAAANADIGVSRAAFYPKLEIRGFAGFQSVDAATWFDWPSRLWSVGPSLQVPIFTGGRNRAQLALSEATYREVVAKYRQTVLLAFQEVEDRLSEATLLQAQIAAESAALAAARRSLEIATNRYQAGLVTYLEVVSAQTAALNVERTLVQVQGQRAVSAVRLVKALGGGWQTSAPEETGARANSNSR